MASPLGETVQLGARFSTCSKGKERQRVIKANKMTKRIGNLWDTLVSDENLWEAYRNARKGKAHRPDVQMVDADPARYIKEVQRQLVTKTYHTSEYRMFEIHEKGKTRQVADLPFFPDRIVHWALILVLHKMLMSNLIPQTYAALPGRGAHQAVTKLKRYLRNPDAKYYLKLDVKKYFPSIDKDVLMRKLSDRIKDPDVIQLCEVVVYEYPLTGLPIGNYTSQYFANFYLSELDHYMKERYHARYYLRYMDDIVILGWSKPWLHRALKRIGEIIGPWGLQIKRNWCIRPTWTGIDFVGYVTHPDYCLLRKRTKIRMIRACKRISARLNAGLDMDDHDKGVIASYIGCLAWCDGHYLGMKTVYPLKSRLEA